MKLTNNYSTLEVFYLRLVRSGSIILNFTKTSIDVIIVNNIITENKCKFVVLTHMRKNKIKDPTSEENFEFIRRYNWDIQS